MNRSGLAGSSRDSTTGHGLQALARGFLALACFLIAAPSVLPAAEDQWSTEPLGFVEVIAVQGRQALGVVLQGSGQAMPNPAGCQEDLRQGKHEAPGSWAERRLIFNVLYLDLPLQAETPEMDLQLRLVAKAIFAAHMSRRNVSVLVDGTSCSSYGRPIIKAVRVHQMQSLKSANGER